MAPRPLPAAAAGGSRTTLGGERIGALAARFRCAERRPVTGRHIPSVLRHAHESLLWGDQWVRAVCEGEMTQSEFLAPSSVPVGVDPTRASIARVYDAALGGPQLPDPRRAVPRSAGEDHAVSRLRLRPAHRGEHPPDRATGRSGHPGGVRRLVSKHGHPCGFATAPRSGSHGNDVTLRAPWRAEPGRPVFRAPSSTRRSRT